jgi:hypothetical protein
MDPGAQIALVGRIRGLNKVKIMQFRTMCILLAGSLFLITNPIIRGDELIKKMPTGMSTKDSGDSACDCRSTVTVPPQKICIEMSAPDVCIKPAVAPACQAEQSGLIKRCCHWLHKSCCVPVAPMTYAIQPQAVAPATMAIQPYSVQPLSVQSFAAQPLSVQPFSVAPLSVSSFAAQPTAFAAPFSAAPFSLGASSFAVQPTIQLQATGSALATPLTLNVVPQQAKPEAAKPEAATDASSAVNDALKKLSTSVQLLTKIVDRHADILLYHDKRLKVLEALQDPEKLKKKTEEIEKEMESKKK